MLHMLAGTVPLKSKLLPSCETRIVSRETRLWSRETGLRSVRYKVVSIQSRFDTHLKSTRYKLKSIRYRLYLPKLYFRFAKETLLLLQMGLITKPDIRAILRWNERYPTLAPSTESPRSWKVTTSIVTYRGPSDFISNQARFREEVTAHSAEEVPEPPNEDLCFMGCI